jgi:hypothetical protein
MPQNQGEIIILLALFAQLKQRTLPGARIEEINDESVYFAVFLEVDAMAGAIGCIPRGKWMMSLGRGAGLEGGSFREVG